MRNIYLYTHLYSDFYKVRIQIAYQSFVPGLEYKAVLFNSCLCVECEFAKYLYCTIKFDFGIRNLACRPSQHAARWRKRWPCALCTFLPYKSWWLLLTCYLSGMVSLYYIYSNLSSRKPSK